MSRFVQPVGVFGSRKWTQRLVNVRPDVLDSAVLPALRGARKITWLSPKADDGFAEYRDRDFLEIVGHSDIVGLMRSFWPEFGPQWTGLGHSEKGDVLLLDSKAHLDDLCANGAPVNAEARARIETAMTATMVACSARPKSPWVDSFYQFAIRLAHLHFLRQSGVRAWLVMVNFVGDEEIHGPGTKAEWVSAYHVVHHVMGINTRSPLMQYVLHAYPDVADLQKPVPDGSRSKRGNTVASPEPVAGS